MQVLFAQMIVLITGYFTFNGVQVSGPYPCGWLNGRSFLCKFHGGFQCEESLLCLEMEFGVANFIGDLWCHLCVEGRRIQSHS